MSTWLPARTRSASARPLQPNEPPAPTIQQPETPQPKNAETSLGCIAPPHTRSAPCRQQCSAARIFGTERVDEAPATSEIPSATAAPRAATPLFRCPRCPRDFRNPKGRAIHLARFCKGPLPVTPNTTVLEDHPPVSSRNFACPRCHRIFTSHQGVAIHETRFCKVPTKTPPPPSTTAHPCLPPHSTTAPTTSSSGPKTTDPTYPTKEDRQRISEFTQRDRPKFKLPSKTDTAAWISLSASLHQACLDILDDPLAARGLDNLHIALSTALSDLGQLSTRAQQEEPRRRPAPLSGQIRTAKTCLNRSKKAAKKTPGSHGEEVRANKAVLGALQTAAAEDQSARTTRHHHKLATTNPKKLADIIWGRAMSSDPPDCSAADCEKFFNDVFRATEVPTTSPHWLPEQRPPLPLSPLIISADSIRHALRRKSGTTSSPGLDGITYETLSCLPWIPDILADLFTKLTAQQTPPEIWRYGLTVLLHKGGTKELGNFRPITLTPTIAKLFHSIVATWMEPTVTASGIIPTQIQKGFLMGVSGAVEHDLVLDEALTDAKHAKKSFFMVLVDLKNAFGSVPHQRISWALQRYGIPPWVSTYVSNLYQGMYTKMSCKSWTTGFLQVERGVLQGDTLSPLLFLLVMQVGLHGLTTSFPNYGYRTATDQPLHFLKCFADDLTIITQNAPKLQKAVDKFATIAEWLGLEMKPAKCRAFGLSRGKYRSINISINRQTILNVADAPSKFLGMSLSLSQTFQEKATIASASIAEILAALDQFQLPPADKVKLYKNFALPKLRWILLVQDVLPTALSKITRTAESLLKKWWRLPRSTSRDALRLLVGIPSLTSIAEQSQATKYAIAQRSSDPSVRAVWHARAARRHKPTRTLLAQFGANLPPSAFCSKQLKKTQTAALTSTVQQLLVQGQWAKLTSPEDERKWRTLIWGLPSATAEFATKAALDVLPTSANLHRWKVADDPICHRCEVKDTLFHTLNNCTPLLPAYKWRHNSVLSHLFSFLQQHHAPSETVMADLPGHTYVLPLPTALRPDLALQSENHIKFVELTIAFESNQQTSHAHKSNKYAHLPALAASLGITATVACIEMGSRGLPSAGWKAWATACRIPPRITAECAAIALSCSRVIWTHRNTQWPDPPLMSPQPTSLRPAL